MTSRRLRPLAPITSRRRRPLKPWDAEAIRFGLRVAHHDVERIRAGKAAVGISKNAGDFDWPTLARKAYAAGIKRYTMTEPPRGRTW
jgi:hypothetical protein